MRIAFDATPAAVQSAGVGRYARELLAALVTLDDHDEYVLASAGSGPENARLLNSLPPGALREVRRLPLNSRWTTAAWHRVRLPLRVERLIGNFDVFHGTDFVVPPSRLPRVVTVHDLSFLIAPEFGESNLVRYLSQAVPRSLSAARAVITVSAAVAAEVAQAFPDIRDKLVAIPNGVRCPVSQPVRVSGSRPIVLAVGTVEPRKNLPSLIQAMRIVRSTHPDAILCIAGRVGWRSDEIIAAIRAAEDDGVVRFVEAPNDERLEALFAEATLVATPSYYEGFGLPVLEAMVRAVPVVAGDIPALRETAGDAARFSDPNDVEAIAGEIVRFLDSDSLRNEYAALGIARAGMFSWNETARRTRRVYQRATGG